MLCLAVSEEAFSERHILDAPGSIFDIDADFPVQSDRKCCGAAAMRQIELDSANPDGPQNRLAMRVDREFHISWRAAKIAAEDRSHKTTRHQVHRAVFLKVVSLPPLDLVGREELFYSLQSRFIQVGCLDMPDMNVMWLHVSIL